MYDIVYFYWIVSSFSPGLLKQNEIDLIVENMKLSMQIIAICSVGKICFGNRITCLLKRTKK